MEIISAEVETTVSGHGGGPHLPHSTKKRSAKKPKVKKQSFEECLAEVRSSVPSVCTIPIHK